MSSALSKRHQQEPTSQQLSNRPPPSLVASLSHPVPSASRKRNKTIQRIKSSEDVGRGSGSSHSSAQTSVTPLTAGKWSTFLFDIDPVHYRNDNKGQLPLCLCHLYIPLNIHGIFLFTCIISDNNWGAFNHASHASQLLSDNYRVCLCVPVHVSHWHNRLKSVCRQACERPCTKCNFCVMVYKLFAGTLPGDDDALWVVKHKPRTAVSC